jgi:HEAT repeat protein
LTIAQRLGSIAAAALVTAGAIVCTDGPLRAQAQVTFEQMVADLGADSPSIRLRAVQALGQAAYPEAAVPLAGAVTDADDAVQVEAVGAELNLFLADKIVRRKRVGLIVEVRHRIAAPAIFDQGPNALEPVAVPVEVLSALRAASHDDNPRVSIEAMYAFGALSDNVFGQTRLALLAAASNDLATSLGSPEADLRGAAIRVISRLYRWEPNRPPVDPGLGDALVGTLNDDNGAVRDAALQALADLRYDRAVQAITELFEHHQRSKAAAAELEALARIAHPSSFPLFTSSLAEGERSLKLAAIDGLARSGDATQEATIRQALTSERDDAVVLAGAYAEAMLANGPLDPLIAALSRPRLHDRALQYLVDLAPQRSASIGTAIQQAEPRVRVDLLDVLARSGDPQAATAAERLEADPDPLVARAATRAVTRLRGVSPGR